MKPIGIYSSRFPLYVEIYEITSDYVKYKSGTSFVDCEQKQPKFTKAKIRYNRNGDSYFVSKQRRIPLNECLRIDIGK